MRFSDVSKKRVFSFFPILRIQRFRRSYTSVLIGCIALGFIVIAPRFLEANDTWKAWLFDTIAPALQFIETIKTNATETWDNISAIPTLQEKIHTLTQENITLQKALTHWQTVQRRNQILTQSLKIIEGMPKLVATIPVLTNPLLGFHHTLIIAGGASHGLTVDQPVLIHQNLIGRIKEMGGRTARVILLTDLTSRVPVMIGDTNDHAILLGNGSPHPQLLYLDKPHDVKVGAPVVTSGYGGIFPEGLPVGHIQSVHAGIARVTLSAQWDHLRYVHILEKMPSLQEVDE